VDSKSEWYRRPAIAGASKYRRREGGEKSARPTTEPSQDGGGSQSREHPAFKILIVEDNRSFREALGASLQAHFPNLNVTAVARVTEARAKVQSMQPDLMFVDMRLPDGNGLDFTSSMRAAGNKFVIIILTSHDLPEYREAASRSGADHFMTKGSVDLNHIFAVVESILASRSGKHPR
jgi:DNA-binding NarL/FixJ family response regulator